MTETRQNGPVDLTHYDVILANTSAGKDSQAMLDVLAELADAAGVRDRIIAVHCDLGRVEWPGTVELAEEQAAHYGFPFVTVKRDGTVTRDGRVLGDLLDQIEKRGMFPSKNARYCTSDQKTSQVYKLMTALVDLRLAQPGHENDRVRILNALGIRADESPARAKMVPFGPDRASNTKRDVVRWYPIFDWTEEQVWERIRQAGTRHHEAYDLGMPRLSCCFCVFATKDAARDRRPGQPRPRP